MKKIFFSSIFLPLVITNTGQAEVETIIKNEVSGENASTKTEVTNIVNDKEVRVESDQPGEIRVEVKNGEVKVESSSEAEPTIIISGKESEEIEVLKEKEIEVKNKAEALRIKIDHFFKDLFSRLRQSLFFWQS